MPDMLVKLYELPDVRPVLAEQRALGLDMRRGMPAEKHILTAWIRQHFSELWVSETEAAFARMPVSCWVAVRDGYFVGFACYDATTRGFFGPMGVDESLRGRGTGRALLLACLDDMRTIGYGYAIIGAAGPTEFYTRTCGAQVIPGSWPSVYRGMVVGEGKVADWGD